MAAGEHAPRQEQPVMSMWSHRPELWRLAVFFAAYVLGGGFAQSLAIIPGSGISIWPNSGLFLATLLVARPQSWPWWLLAGCAAELVGNALWFRSPLPAALLIYAGNALEAMTGAFLLTRVLGRPVQLSTLREVLVFVALGAGVAPLVSATVGATTIASFGMLSQTFAGAWQLLWIGDAAGVLIAAPLALAVLTHWRGDARLSAARWIEAGAVALVFVAVATLALGGALPFAYIIMPPLLWAAVRFEFKGAAVALAALALFTAMFTINGASQFAGDAETQRQRHIMLQLFLAVSAFSALIVAAISRQHQQALRTLRASEQQLRELVGVVPVALARLDADGRPSFFNTRLADLLGLEPQDLDLHGPDPVASKLRAAIHPDDAAGVQSALDAAINAGEPFVQRYRLRRADGVYRWVEHRIEPLRGPDGAILHWYGATFDIDDQVRLNREIEERDAQIRRLVDSDVIGIVIWDLDGTLIDANDAFLRMVQYERQDVAEGMRWFDMTPPEWQEVHAREEAEELAGTGMMRPREKEFFRKDGSRVPVLIGAATFEGQSNRGVAYILDLTDRKRAEAALRDRERELSQLVDMVPSCLWRMEPDGAPAFFNRRFVEFLGFDVTRGDKAHWLSALIEAAVHPEDAAAVAAAFDQCLATGEPLSMTWRMRRADGVYRWMAASAEATRDEHGAVLQWYGLCHDIDDQIRTEEALREREFELSQLIELAPVHISRMSPTGEPTWYNKRTLDALGITDVADWDQPGTTRLSAQLNASLHPEDAQRMGETIQHALATGTPYSIRFRRRTADGGYQWREGRADPLRDEDGTIVEWYCATLDVDAQVRAEIALSDQKRELSQLVDMVPSHLWRTDPDGTPTFFNHRLVEFLGFDVPRDGESGLRRLTVVLEAALHPGDVTAVSVAFERCLGTGEPFSMMLRLRRADGVYRWMAASAEPMRNRDHEIVQWYGLCHDIDDQIRAEQALQERELELRQLIEMSPVHLSRMSPTGDPTWYNQRTLEALGIQDIADWDEPGVSRLSSQMSNSLHPEDAQRMADVMRDALATGTPYTMRYRRRRLEGGYQWREARADPFRDENGEILHWYCASLDVDAQVRAELALSEQKRELSQLVDMVPSHLWRMDPDGAPAFFNQRLVEFLGFDATAIDKPAERRLSALIEAAIHPDDAAAAAEAFEHCLATGEPLSMKWRMRRADGVYRWMTASAEALRNDEGEIVQWYGLCHDVDDQVRSEEALREREQELSLLVEMLPVTVSRMSPTGEPTYYSQRTLTSLGMAQLGDWDAPGATRLWSMVNAAIHPDDVARMNETIQHAMATATPYSLRYRRREADGAYRWKEGRADPLRDENGAIVQWYCVAIDIDAQVRAEIALRESERKLREIIDAVPVRIWSTTSTGGPAYFNRRYQDHFRETVPNFEDMQDARFEELFQALVHPDDAPGAQATLSRCFETGESAVMRFRWREADGTYRWVESRVEPRRDDDGAIVQWYGASVDIDDEVRAQEALLLAQERVARASQAASLAELSASIAHEVNQPLAAVVANSHACQRWLTVDPPNIGRAQSTVERIIRDANAAGEVVSRIRALFKQSVNTRSEATLERVIAEARTSVADTSVGAVSVEVQLDPDLPAIPFDHIQIQQVLINLLRNAADAMAGMPGPKVVRVRVRREADVLQVEVSDTGDGIIDPAKIFDPFFTTKENGMGMGLAISKSIVESHGGRMWARNNEEGGATLAFTLPVEAPVLA